MAADAAGSAQLPTPETGADGVESKAAAARSGRGGHAASHGRVPACKPCRERKRKCDGGRPCSRCVQCVRGLDSWESARVCARTGPTHFLTKRRTEMAVLTNAWTLTAAGRQIS